MIVFLCLRWWYSAGWLWVWQTVFVQRCEWVMETFSVSDLLKTLFAPFRQTYAGNVKGSLDVKLHAFFDKTISRAIGFVVRMVLLFMALIALLVAVLLAIVSLIIWPLIPAAPIVSVFLIVSGVGK